VVGTDPREILQSALHILNAPPPKNLIPDKWDGHAGERIADILVEWLSPNRITAVIGTAATSGAGPAKNTAE